MRLKFVNNKNDWIILSPFAGPAGRILMPCIFLHTMILCEVYKGWKKIHGIKILPAGLANGPSIIHGPHFRHVDSTVPPESQWPYTTRSSPQRQGE